MRGVSAGALARVAFRPELWPTALAQWRSLCPPRWWSRWPPLPRPAPGYLSFRLEAMYGPGRQRVRGMDLAEYLEWCRWVRSLPR